MMYRFSSYVKTAYTAAMVLVLLLAGGNAIGQTVAGSYQQSRITSGTFLSPGSTTSLFGSNWAGSTASVATVTIPFTFVFAGTSTTTCYVNPNGYITFGATSTLTNYTPMSVHDPGVTGIVAAVACSTFSPNPVTYGVTGTAPNRVFSIIWNTARFGAMTNSSLNFQINLFETTNKIQIVYSTPTLGAAGTTATAQVGIGGSTTADYLNWTESATVTTTTAGGNSGTNWPLLRPATTVGATCVLNRSNAAYFPANNLTLEYTPALPLLSPSAISNTGFTINWNEASGATSYKIEVGTTATLSTLIAGSPTTISAPATSTSITGLTTGTKYWYRVTPNYSSTGLVSASAIYSITMPVVTPLTISSGFNYDIIANGSNTIAGTTSTLGSVNCILTGYPSGTGAAGFDNGNYVLAASDFYNALTFSGLPIGGSVRDTASAGVVYQLAPYNTNNSYWCSSSSASAAGTLSFSTPVSATSLYLLSSSGGGAGAASFRVNFSDTAVPYTVTGQTINDWCGGTASARVMSIMPRVAAGGGTDASATCPYLYRNIIALPAAYYNKTITGVTITATGSNFPAFFGVSALRTAVITSTATSLTGFATASCVGISPSQTITLTGANLANSTANTTGTGNVTVTAPTGFKVSLNNTTFTSTVTIPFSNCAFAATALYVRMESTTIGTLSGNITFSGVTTPTANLLSIPVSGTVGGVQLKPALTVTYPASRGTINFGVITSGTTSAAIVDSFSGFGLTGNVTVTSTNPDFQYSLDGITYSSSVTIIPTGTSVFPSIPFYTKVTPSTTGPITATLTMSGGTPTTCTYTFKDSVYGGAPCVSPSLPTTLTFTGTSSTGATVGFTPGSTQDGYLVVRSTVPFVAGSDPVAGTNYAVSGAFGNGTVIAINTSAPPYAATGLTGNTTYYYTIVPFNGGTTGGTCGGGPLYAAGTQLTGAVTTCPASPATPTSSGVTSTSFTANWTAPAGGGAVALSYIVDVSTNNTFTSPISGSPFAVSGTSLSLTGLLSGTAYYVRVTAVGACNSTVSGTLTATTAENYTALTITSGFNADVVANGSTAPTLNTSFPPAVTNGFDNAGYDLVGAPYTFATATRILPAGGSFVSASVANLPFQLADYSGLNALHLHYSAAGTFPTTGTLTFSTPVQASTVYFLGLSGTSSTAVTFRLNFTDGTTETSSAYTYPDWYTNPGTAPISVARAGIGRVPHSTTPTSGETSTTGPNLHQVAYSVSAAGQAKRIASVTVTQNGSATTGYVGIMAVSIRSGSLITSTSSLTAFSSPACTPSSSQTFTISGSALFPSGSNITVKAPAFFQVSANGTSWDTVASIAYTGNTMSNATVYARMNPAAAGNYSGNITFSGGTLNSAPVVAVSGTATGVAFTPTSTAAFGPVSVGSSAGLHYSVGGTTLTPGTLTITSSNTHFEVSSDSVSWSSTFDIANGETLSAPLYIRYVPVSTGAESTNITVTSSSMSCMPSALIATGTGALACTAPASPTTLSFGSVTSSAATLNVTPSGSADAYLVIRSYSAFVPGSDPVTGYTYTIGDTIGNGRVAGVYGSTSPYAFTGLNSNMSYYYTVIPYNGGSTGTCAGGPLYATGTPLSAAVTTCPATPVVGTPSSTVSTATINWTSVGGTSPVTYTIDVALDNAFTMPVTGSPFTVSAPATSLTVTSLPGGGTYYYRIKAANSSCTSAYSATSTVSTSAYCAPTWTAGCSQWRIYSVATAGMSYTGTCGSSFNQTALIDTMTTGVGKVHTIVSGQYLTTAVWVDLNNDGDFTDAGELLFSAAATTAPPNTYTPSLVIPIGTSAGYHRMRVLASWPGIASGPCGAYSGDGGGNFYDFTVFVKATVLTPSTASVPDFGGVATCSNSAAQTFTISSTLLVPASGNIVAHAPAGYQVSTDGAAWDTTATFPYTGSAMASTTVYVRYTPTVVGSTPGNVSFTGGGIATVYVGVSGTGNGVAFTPSSVAAFGPVNVSTSSAPLTYTFTGSGLISGTTTIATSNPDFQVSPDDVTYYTSSYNFASGATISSTPLYIKYTPTSTGAATANITITSPTGCVQTITATGVGALPCSAPSAPTTLTFTGTTASATTVGFTPVGSADGYLVVRSYAPFVGGIHPISTNVYAVNDTFGNGRVVADQTTSTYAASALVSNTNYYYTIIPYNGGPLGSCSGGPLYPAGSPLTGVVTTCPAAPGAPTATPMVSGMTVSWSAPVGGSATSLTYTLEVTSDAGFTTPISGSPFTVTGGATSLTFGGLAASTTYYFRVRANGACTGVVSSTGNATTTLFDYSVIPFTSGSFNADVIANGTGTASATTNNDVDGASWAFVSTDYVNGSYSAPSTALPVSGALNSAATAGLPYQLQSYSANNSLRLTAGTTGTLTLSTPQYASKLFIIATGGSGACSGVTFTANFEGGGTDVLTATVADWFYATPIAVGNVSRVNRTVGNVESPSGGPNYYEYYLDISPTNYSRRITSITVNYTGSGGILNVGAVSKRGGALYASTNVLSAFPTINVGCPSTSQSFTISGSTLYPAGGNITVVAPTGFQVSPNGTDWDTVASIGYSGNALSPATVYARFTPGAAGTYSGNITFLGGTANNTPLVAVSGTATNIAVGLSSSASVYCSGGSSVSLTASGVASYSWAPSAGLSATTGSVVTATPSATTTYTVTGTDAAGCSTYSNTVTVVSNLPTTAISGPGSVLCLPGAMALTQGGTGGTWTSSNTSVATVDASGLVFGVMVSGTPITITYSNPVCGGSATYGITVSDGGFTVGVSPSTGTYCSTGSPLAITASGASTYSWTPSSGLSATAGAVVNASPSVTTTYTVVGTTGACSNAATITVWNTTPGAITGGLTNLCISGVGSTTTWSDTTAGGTWSISPSSGVASITSGGVLTATGVGTAIVTYDRGGCYVTRALTVNSLPVLSVTPSVVAVCGGSSVTMTASGAATYSWAPASGLFTTIGASVAANPSTNTTYTITGTSSVGCVSTTTKFAGVGAGVNALASTGSATVCPGSSTTITGLGMLTYGTSYTVTSIPYALQTFTSSGAITGDNTTGTVTLPFTFNFYGVNYTSLVISTNGKLSFNGVSLTASEGNYSIPSTNSFTYMGIGIAMGMHDYNPSGTMLTYGTVGSAPNRKFVIYENNMVGWTTGNNTTMQTILYEGSNIIEQMVASNTGSTYFSTIGIQQSASVGVAPAGRNGVNWVVTTPEGWRYYPVMSSPTYAWTPSTGVTSSAAATTAAQVSEATVYTVTITESTSGCSDTAMVAVNTFTPPTVTIPTPTIGCGGVAMTATGATSYVWSPSTGLSATTGASVTPSASVTTTTYSVVGTDGNGCKDTATLVVNTTPTVTVTPSTATICVGGTNSLTASGAATYSWTPAATLSSSTDASVTANPTSTTTYSVIGTSAEGCVAAEKTASVTVNAVPVAAALTNTTSYCIGSGLPFTLSTGTPTGTGSLVSYNWSGPGGFSTTTAAPTVSYTPTSTSASGIYSLTVTYAGAGCTSNQVTGATATVADYPTAFNITGGNGCSAAGITVGTSGSQSSSVSYALRLLPLTTVQTLSGSTTSLSFTPVTAAGTYVVVATGPAGCQTTMNGADTIRQTPSATIGVVPSICQPLTTVPVSYSGEVGTPATYSIDWDAAANSAGINDVTNAALSGGTINLAVPASGAVGHYTNTITLSNGFCTSAAYNKEITIYAQPQMSITAVNAPCVGYSGSIDFSGTDSATVDYTVDGGAVNHFTFAGTTYSLSTGVITTAHTYVIQSAHNPVCSNTYDSVRVVDPIPMKWVGGATGHESDWNYAANWTCGFEPTNNDDVTIPAATYTPVLPVSGSGTTRNLTMMAGSSLLINSGASLNVKGDINNNSAISGSGNLVMNGTSAQSIQGIGYVDNFELNNAAGATIGTGSRMMIVKALHMSVGTLNTSDSLELLSTDTFTAARIAEMPSSGTSIAGKVKVDQFIEGGYRRFRFWSHPFSDDISLSQVQKYIDITGPGGSSNGFRTTGSNAPSAFRYDPYLSNSLASYDSGWRMFTRINPSAADSNLLHKGQGIRLFFRGAKGEGLSYAGYYDLYTPSSAIVKMSGNVNQGDVDITLAQGANAASQSFNMVGNPYASPVDIGTVLFNAKQSGQITGSAFYVWMPRVAYGGQYMAIPIGESAPIPYYIQANAAFQVLADHDGAQLHFTEDKKSAIVDNYLFKAPSQYVTLNVYDNNGHVFDRLDLQFNEKATAAIDKRYDAMKPMGTDLNFYSITEDGRKVAIDARPFNEEKAIPLGISSNFAQDFVIRAENVALPGGGTITLHDKLLGKYVEMTPGAEYPFTISKDKTTQGDDRFELTLKPVVSAVKPLAVSLKPNPASDDVKITFTSGSQAEVLVRVMDISGVSIFSQNLGNKQTGVITVPMSNFAAGVYMVEVTQGTQKVSQRLIKE